MLTPQERRALLVLTLLLSIGGGLRALEVSSPRILSLTLGDSLALGFDRDEKSAPDSTRADRPTNAVSAVDPAPPTAAAAYDLSGRLDLNRATTEELETLPGIGPKTAARIVEDRQKRGRFRKPADLTRVKGIGPKTLARLLPHITTASRADSAR